MTDGVMKFGKRKDPKKIRKILTVSIMNITPLEPI